MHKTQQRPKSRPTDHAEPPASQPTRGIVPCLVAVALVALTLAIPAPARAQPDAGPTAAAAEARPERAEPRLFAIEITVGPGWDASKPPNAQAFFAEHSANLRRLRESGQLVVGARYSDKGLIVVRATSPEEVHAMMAQDPSIEAGTFRYEVHPFAVFYPGSVEAQRPGAGAATKPQ
jgi:uncharacterized protein YciI